MVSAIKLYIKMLDVCKSTHPSHHNNLVNFITNCQFIERPFAIEKFLRINSITKSKYKHNLD